MKNSGLGLENLGWIDRSGTLLMGDILELFAFEELACRRVGEGEAPLVHIWRHQKAFVLGLRDRKLPGAPQAMQWLREQGYSVAVRNSGGAAVPLDPGVVNVTLIVPKRSGNLDFHEDFAAAAEWIIQAVQAMSGQPANIGEVTGAYCPGDFDLSLRGKKFCGIAQRRQTRGIIIQAFVNVEGSGGQREELVKRFYEMAMGTDQERHAQGQPALHAPAVEAGFTAALSELIPGADVQTFITLYKQQWKASHFDLLPDEIVSAGDVRRMMMQLRQRYDADYDDPGMKK